jgi:hypothetical protein
MKTPLPDVDAFVEALRGDLPSAEDQARVRARLLAATALASSAALTSTSASAQLGSAGASAATTSGAPAGITLVGASGSAAPVAAGGSAAAGAGTLAAAAPVAKAGLLAKLLVLPLSAKVGAVVAVAVAATSVPLVLEQTRESSEARVGATGVGDARPGPTPPAGTSAPRAQSPLEREVGPAPAEPGSSQVAGDGPSSQAASGGSRERGPAPRRRSITPRRPSPPQAATHAAAPAAAPLKAVATAAAASDALVAPASRLDTAASTVDGSEAAASAVAPDATRTRTAPPPGRAQVALAGESALAEETRLMERAMLAIGDGDAELAQRFLAEHARRFPQGLLAPERERAQRRAQSLADGRRGASSF